MANSFYPMNEGFLENLLALCKFEMFNSVLKRSRKVTLTPWQNSQVTAAAAVTTVL